jgi:hypothetical protein
MYFIIVSFADAGEGKKPSGTTMTGSLAKLLQIDHGIFRRETRRPASRSALLSVV